MIPTSYGIIIMDKENKDSLHGSNSVGAFLMPGKEWLYGLPKGQLYGTTVVHP